MMRFSRAGEITVAILRIGAGVLFMFHGAQKLFGWFGGFGGTPGATAPLISLMGLAGILEFFGGALIALGLLTRPVGLVLAAQMVVAYVMAHLSQGIWPIQNQGEPAVLFGLIFLFFAGNGGGRYSLDHMVRGSRGEADHPNVERPRGRSAA